MAAGLVARLRSGLGGILLAPVYLALAYFKRGHGIGFHLHIVAACMRLLLQGRLSLKAGVSHLFFPMDSTRYFEFQEVWESARSRTFRRYLDISSPRFVPLLLLKSAPQACAELINPDASDLRETRELASALGLEARCGFFNGFLDKAGHPPASFDLITSISVLEHIPDESAVLETMWSLLEPGGRLILTLPCMPNGFEQYISHNQYGVLTPGGDGYTFWQRYYDSRGLQSRIFAVTGAPSRMVVYGEKRRGLFFRNASMKRLLGSLYPFWREPYMMASEYQLFASLDELPGEGVVLLEFVKAETAR